MEDRVARRLAGERPLVLVARMWATVDLERSLHEFGAPGEELADDPLLGATARLVRPAVGDPICLLEPNTEGRLAAGLARNGEGPAGRYLAAPEGLDEVAATAAANGIRFRRAGEGPFGGCILVLDGIPTGSHLVLVEPSAGTIEP